MHVTQINVHVKNTLLKILKCGKPGRTSVPSLRALLSPVVRYPLAGTTQFVHRTYSQSGIVRRVLQIVALRTVFVGCLLAAGTCSSRAGSCRQVETVLVVSPRDFVCLSPPLSPSHSSSVLCLLSVTQLMPSKDSCTS
jgi:hypothetical protein